MKNTNRLSLAQRVGTVALAALATAAGLPVSAATSFPQTPLLTGGDVIPPNILMILDDSGSMEGPWMSADPNGTVDKNSLGDNVVDRSYVNNTLYYDPSKTYLPWRTASTNLNDRMASADFRNVASSTTSPTPGWNGGLDLRGSSESFFYVPKVANPGTTASNYDKYRIASSSSATSYNGGVVQKRTSITTYSGTYSSSISAGNWYACTQVQLSGNSPVTITVSGHNNADLYVYSSSTCSSGLYDQDTSNNNPKSLTVTPNDSATSIYIRVRNDRNSGSISNIRWTTTQDVWADATPSGNTGALQRAELQNFANWYQYHRTRNKMAKAGASEAFGRLGKNYRIGFDTIWNRGGGSQNTGGSTPAYPIPYLVRNGLFEDDGTSVTNRTSFFSMLQAAGASSTTPLKGSLQRAARYFATDNPWKNSDGGVLTCRQNYSILTTDGYWNDNSGYITNVNNADNEASWPYRDSYWNTLADVAYYYWKNDLKTGPAWPDNVRSSAADGNNTKQHMVTFGVSIGLRGTLDQNNPPPTPWNVDPINNSGPERIDDLWHAAINGHGSFIVAKDTDTFASALIGAFQTIDGRSASGSNIASSSTKTDTATLTFEAGFTSSTWVGDLQASKFNEALTGVSDTPEWRLSDTFGATGVNATYASRTVLTNKGGTPQVLGPAMSGAGDFAARTGQADAVTVAENIAYLKGDQSMELSHGGTLRNRRGPTGGDLPVGDIVDSSPVHVADSNTVYIGANDGMLHGIDASNGKVLFSYMPKGINYVALNTLSSTDYTHNYFVDGQIDVVSKAVQGNGKNILVGALGRGGRGVFALDVTTPTAMAPASVLWDNTTQDATTDPNMGYVLGAVRIRKASNGKVYALVPNGIDSPNGSATLFVYELTSTGTIASTTRLVADSTGGNGLMSLGLADLNSDGKLDTVYGGDLKGNVWRWDFSGNALPIAATKLFQAMDATGKPQPITGGIGVGRDSTTGTVFLGFGTGRFISDSDVPGPGTPQTTQSVYGIIDTNTLIASRDDLQQRGVTATSFDTYSALPSGKRGWYIDLPVPERVISAPRVYGTSMYFSSVVPATGSSCEGVSGSGFLNSLNMFTGTGGGRTTVSGGMPTEVNLTSALATVGTGELFGKKSVSIPPPPSGAPQRVNWREIVPQQ